MLSLDESDLPTTCSCSTIRKRIISTSTDHGRSKVYLKDGIYDLFIKENIERVLSCGCHQCSEVDCAAPGLVDIILAEYRIILAILLHVGNTTLIHGFIARRFTDNFVLNNYLSEETIRAISDEAVQRGSISELDIDFAKQFFDRQSEFLLPELNFCPDTIKKLDLPAIQSLPVAEGHEIGSGSAAIVIEAQLFQGYHNLPEDDVAIKQYKGCSDSGYESDDEIMDDDWAVEHENHQHFKHEFILPIWGVVQHGKKIMTVAPLLKGSLSQQMKQECDLSIACIARNMVNIFDALNHMHFGVSGFYGYHFDVKPANILRNSSGEWFLADLGQAYFQPIHESPTAEKQPGSMDYAAPDGDIVDASYDMWAIGAVFLEVLVWSMGGTEYFQEFRRARCSRKGYRTVYDFHTEGETEVPELKAPVSLVIQSFDECGDPLVAGCAEVVRGLLEIQNNKRWTAAKAASHLRKLLENTPEEVPEALVETIEVPPISDIEDCTQMFDEFEAPSITVTSESSDNKPPAQN
ncbi:Similar to Aurora kinase A; acc. no. P97477 [Pyronema omphalodes CBS 100304]|uniref:Similar to Aurora kinase A acc. no. P97477 n=1 Tax=Pyronema omphalodes (strain CBS 100304) TaxID=1076935 RepID=U4KVB1_PYROM|nr:Similar to Aurora kinase A; acc. no. P97477 [Pyronema omphalodes CBS 100304]